MQERTHRSETAHPLLLRSGALDMEALDSPAQHKTLATPGGIVRLDSDDPYKVLPERREDVITKCTTITPDFYAKTPRYSAAMLRG